MKKFSALFLAIAAILPIAAAQAAATSGSRPATSAKPVSMSLSAQQRGDAIGQFVRKWGAYVEQTYAIDAGTWSKRLVRQFATGDAVNIQRALGRATFEGAISELNGSGKRFTDEQAITRMASLSSGSSALLLPQVLGSTTDDLVYTPVTPCRLVDTRLAAGAIPANSDRSFTVWGETSYAFQGGSATDCGLFNENPAVAVVNITAVQPTNGGYATAYAYGTPKPLVATINYAGGAIVNNLANVDISNSIQLYDLTLYTFAAANYVVDIVGYYDAPHATALDCTTATSASVLVAAGGTGSVPAPTCGTGFSTTGINCDADQTSGRLIGFNTSQCTYQNSGAGAINITAGAVCCRVPGR